MERLYLVELLVVISIIGLLASVVTASLNGARSKAKWARTMSDFNQMGKAAELFMANENLYSCDAPPGYDTRGSTAYPCGGQPGDHGYTLGGIRVNGTSGGSLVCQ